MRISDSILSRLKSLIFFSKPIHYRTRWKVGIISIFKAHNETKALKNSMWKKCLNNEVPIFLVKKNPCQATSRQINAFSQAKSHRSILKAEEKREKLKN